MSKASIANFGQKSHYRVMSRIPEISFHFLLLQEGRAKNKTYTFIAA